MSQKDKTSINKLIYNPWVITVIGGILVGLVILALDFNKNPVNNKNTSFENSPQCNGNDCEQSIQYTQIFQEEKLVYVSPEKKLIKPNMAHYSFPFKIVNERSEDFNDMGLMYAVPADYGIYRIAIKPKDETEQIRKYNNSLQIMLPCFGWQKDDKYLAVCYIESIYKLEIKEYEITVDTRGYSQEFYMEFGLIDLSSEPELKAIFQGFGVE